MKAIGTQFRDLMNSGRTRWRLMVKMDAVAESRGIPRLSARFSLSVEIEQAHSGQDGRSCLARPNSQARTGTGGK